MFDHNLTEVLVLGVFYFCILISPLVLLSRQDGELGLSLQGWKVRAHTRVDMYS